MSRIYITGSVASGKTTFAKRLSQKVNTPWFELDCIIYCEAEGERYKRTPEQQLKVVNEINDRGDWIIEGTYRPTCHCLLELADRIVFLDTPLWKRRIRILVRFIKQQLHIEKCHYRSNHKMLKLMYKWTDDFEKDRAAFLELIDGFYNKLEIIRDSKSLY